MLPNSARIKSSSDFARVTKLGTRSTTNSLIGYLLQNSQTQSQNQSQIQSNKTNKSNKLGLIVGKSIGNSVVRHRVARQIRHSAKEPLSMLPTGSLLVIRAMKLPEDAFDETKELFEKVIAKQKSGNKPAIKKVSV